MTTPDPVNPVVDEELLARLEQDLADAAAALERIEEIITGNLGPAERVAAMDAITSGGRFEVAPSELDAEAGQRSDLVGHGDLGAFEQLETLAEDEPPLA